MKSQPSVLIRKFLIFKMNDERLAEIHAAYGKASPGPWFAEKAHDLWWHIYSGNGFAHKMLADCVADNNIDLLSGAHAYIRDCLAEIDYWRTKFENANKEYPSFPGYAGLKEDTND